MFFGVLVLLAAVLALLLTCLPGILARRFVLTKHVPSLGPYGAVLTVRPATSIFFRFFEERLLTIVLQSPRLQLQLLPAPSSLNQSQSPASSKTSNSKSNPSSSASASASASAPSALPSWLGGVVEKALAFVCVRVCQTQIIVSSVRFSVFM